MSRLHEWLIEEQPKHVPKGPLGQAISYALNQWERLLSFSRKREHSRRQQRLRGGPARRGETRFIVHLLVN